MICFSGVREQRRDEKLKKNNWIITMGFKKSKKEGLE